MSKQVPMQESQQQGFFDRPKNVSRIIMALYILCGLLLVADFLVHRHIYTDVESIPAFYPLFGLLASVVLVAVAKLLRRGVMHEENYYHSVDNLPADDAQHSDQEAK